MVSVDANMMAQRLNGAFTAFGGQEIAQLRTLPVQQLQALSGNMQLFLDGVGGSGGQSAAVAAMVGGQSLAGLRHLAAVSSQFEPSLGRSSAFAGGGVGGFSVLGPLTSTGVNFDPVAGNALTRPPVGAAAAVLGSEDASATTLRGVGGSGSFFEDKVFDLMIKIVEDFQKKIEDRLKKLQADAKKAEQEAKGGGKKKGKGLFGSVLGIVGKVAGGVFGGPIGAAVGGAIGSKLGGAVDGKGGGGGGSGGGGAAGSSESRNIEFEKVKFDMQKLSQMQQALSNILNTLDELAKSAIRHIKV